MKIEEQDQLWNELSEETKQEYREKYKFHLANSKREMKCNDGSYDLTVLRSNTIVDELVNMFGSHNLNPNQIKTWEDVPLRGEKLDIELYDQMCNIAINRFEIDDKIIDKAIATFRIAWLIELGYGGAVTKEEWKKSASYDKEDALWTIVCECKKEYQEPQFRIACNWEQVDFLSFHSKELAEEFWSHESNRQLVKQYFLM